MPTAYPSLLKVINKIVIKMILFRKETTYMLRGSKAVTEGSQKFGKNEVFSS
jgi:hypothetical protein